MLPDVLPRATRTVLNYLTSSPRPVRLIVYGRHSADWNTALAPDAPVWNVIGQVGEVMVLPHEAPLPPSRSGWRTLILPLMEPHILACARDRHEGLMPSHHAVRTLADKALFASYAESHGLGRLCPPRFASTSEAALPCVVKRHDLNGGCGVEIAESIEGLAELSDIEPWKGHPVLLQGYEPSPAQYVTHAVCRSGRILWQVTYRQTLADGARIRRWNTALVQERVSPAAAWLDGIERFLRPLSYSGPCCVDYIARADGSLCVFEINPRLGGSLMMPENVGDLGALLRTLLRFARPLATG